MVVRHNSSSRIVYANSFVTCGCKPERDNLEKAMGDGCHYLVRKRNDPDAVFSLSRLVTDRVVPYNRMVENFVGISVTYIYDRDGSKYRCVHVYYNVVK